MNLYFSFKTSTFFLYTHPPTAGVYTVIIFLSKRCFTFFVLALACNGRVYNNFLSDVLHFLFSLSYAMGLCTAIIYYTKHNSIFRVRLPLCHRQGVNEHKIYSIIIISCPNSIASPLFTLIFDTVPLYSLVTSFINFMDSMIKSTSPFFTFVPTVTKGGFSGDGEE